MRPHQPRQTDAPGHTVHYQLWPGPSGPAPSILLVHGSGAHSHWWDGIAGLLDDRFQVAAIDLPGMGDSEALDSYSRKIFSDALMAVCEDAGLDSDRRLYLVGHSFGGAVAMQAAHRFSDRISGLVIADTPVRPPDYDYGANPRNSPIRPARFYPTRDVILSRFRLMPPQPPIPAWMHQYIARYSVRFFGTDKGWRWKFDDQIFNKMGNEMLSRNREIEQPLPCPMTFVYGTESMLMTDEVVNYMSEVLQRKSQESDLEAEVIPWQGMHHHLILEQPQEFAELVASRVGKWEQSATG